MTAETRMLNLDRFRPWLLAAAIYNLAAGAAIALVPRLTLDVAGVREPTVLPLWQVVGMQVLLFAPAYWWASRDPWSHRHLVLIGASAKVLGVAGFLVAAGFGQLPLSFGVVVLFNDAIWLPALLMFVFTVGKRVGWRSYVTGD